MLEIATNEPHTSVLQESDDFVVFRVSPQKYREAGDDLKIQATNLSNGLNLQVLATMVDRSGTPP